MDIRISSLDMISITHDNFKPVVGSVVNRYQGRNKLIIHTENKQAAPADGIGTIRFYTVLDRIPFDGRYFWSGIMYMKYRFSDKRVLDMGWTHELLESHWYNTYEFSIDAVPLVARLISPDKLRNRMAFQRASMYAITPNDWRRYAARTGRVEVK